MIRIGVLTSVILFTGVLSGFTVELQTENQIPIVGETLHIQLKQHITLTLVREKFQAKKYRIHYWKGSKAAIYSIDGKLVFGTDAMMPRYILKSAQLRIRKRVIQLPVDGMYDPWLVQPLKKIHFRIGKFMENPYKLRGCFSHGAGHYGVEWQIFDGKAIRTIITNDHRITDQFLKSEE